MLAGMLLAGTARADEPAPAPAPKPKPKPPQASATIVVPASVVAKAIERRDVSATNATKPDGSPLGARLVGVGKYGAGLRDGDVVVAVEGRATPTVDAMVAAGLGAVQRGAQKIAGKIVRGESTTIAVVLELPRVTAQR